MKMFYSLVIILIFNQHKVLSSREKVQKFEWGDAEYEDTVPVRVNQAGKAVYPENKQFLSFDNRGVNRGSLYYNVRGFGRTFRLVLTQDHSFVSPGLKVEYVFSELKTLQLPGDLGYCLYRGRLQDSASSAVFNLCNGIQGSFITDGHEFFIEKRQGQKGNSSNIHIIYRRLNTVKEKSRDSQTFCGLEDTSPSITDYKHLHDRVVNGFKRRRSKRYLDAAFVETMVAVDRTMVEAFPNKAELQSFLITVMGLVAKIYSHESIGNYIKVVLVKIFILENDMPELKITSNAANTLSSFCRWQKKMNKASDSDNEHYDTAILITKHDLCRAKGRCDTLGLAHMGTICEPRRSCAIVEATGLNTAYTIAHEMAHIFDIPHDGDNNNCTSDRGLSNIMAPTLSYYTSPWKWSPCSRRAISETFDLGYAECLKDRPDPRREGLYDRKLPGELYSADQQCQMLYDKQSVPCSNVEVCRRLWCQTEVSKTKRQRGCKTHHLPWADGTPCGENKWCIRDKCVPKRRLRVVQGNWGSWSSYGPCSRTCGGGITFATRKCDNPAPENGGTYCWGARKRFRSCNTDECPPYSRDFRTLQCQRLNGKNLYGGLGIKNATFIPKYLKKRADQCKLYCQVNGNSMWFKLATKVIDGTRCNTESYDVCVEGQCRKAGCNNVVGSNTRNDVCGVCGGDGSSCRKHTGYFNKKPKYGYNFVYDIPVGSTNVVIKQYGMKKNDVNYLVLQSVGRNKKGLLNSLAVVISGVREINHHGVTIWYSGSDKEIEEIRIYGKTKQLLRLKVLSIESPENDETVKPRITYSLNVPYIGPARFYWSKFGEWSPCNRVCRGRRRRKILCIRRDDNKVVGRKKCRRYRKPNKIVEQCNTHCSLRWFKSRIGQCSTLCGKGTQVQHARCVIDHGRKLEFVTDDSCKHIPRPPKQVPCKGPCKTSWTYTNWSKCSKSCGSGIQQRFVNCINSAGDYVADKDCKLSDRQILQKSCFEQECPIWVADRWSSCSVTCGRGVEWRKVTCSVHGKQFHASSCDKKQRPTERRSCSREKCPSWVMSRWSECSVTCGKGFQERQVLCRSASNRVLISNIKCDTSEKPESRQECIKPACPVSIQATPNNNRWLEGGWSECSVTCGRGLKRRRVICSDSLGEEIDMSNCDKNIKPKTEEECLLKSCTSWKFGLWGMCSKSCGTGLQLRIVKCAYDSWEVADDKLCKGMTKPVDHRPCEIQPCRQTPTKFYEPTREHTTTVRISRWDKGEWGQCSVTCGSGLRRRSVTCRYIGGGFSNRCSSSNKPKSTSVCELAPCPRWKTGDWNQCSKTCGGGVAYRPVMCSREDGGCNNSSKPKEMQECNKQKCPQWIAGSWNECSVTCGGGTQSRIIKCQNGPCDSKSKPITTNKCNVQQCPKWIAQKWSSCSVSCGKGTVTRQVSCSTENKCNEKTKPLMQKHCYMPVCPSWTAEPWSKCSVSCGNGIQRRRITCQPPSGRCDRRLKPDITKRCNPGLCPAWIASEWSKCSASCGEGIRRRDVECNSTIFKCDDKIRPVNAERCRLEYCPQWTFGQWSQCSSSCGDGVQKRNVTCQPTSARCDDSLKPENTKICNRGHCPAWTVGAWSKCSVSCGDGTRTRTVECNSTVFNCDPSLQRPSIVQRCNRGKCPVWTAGLWSECSSSCGKGIQMRSIKCQPLSSECDSRKKPKNYRVCNLGGCPVWQAQPWSQCSVSCGDGVRTRTVRCKSAIFECDEKLRPQNSERCNLDRCPVWKAGHWSECSSSCGEGFQNREVKCDSPNARCNNKLKPEHIKSCNLGTCPGWTTGLWTKCSVSCGNGVKTRSVRCNSTALKCNRQTRPVNVGRCNPGPCPVWNTGRWSVCSVTCGQGVRSRDVECSTRDAPCSSSKPPSQRACIMDPCPQWIAGRWEECSVTCGDGVQRRSVTCNTGEGSCDSENRPNELQNCERVPCPRWITESWSKCSVSCGNGVQTREVTCDSDRVPCDKNIKPDTRRVCNTHKCPTWKTGSWSECSVSCGNGVQTREVTCDSDRVPCDKNIKPDSRRICNTHKCPTWKTGAWSECSVSCGNGVKTREVTCDSDRVPCDQNSKPDSRRICNTHKCPTWKTGAWSECSVSCGNGVQTREVTCDSDRVPCDQNSKPDSRRVCNTHKCPTWKTDEWSECSVSCGNGIQTRDVTCDSDRVPCDKNIKPDSRRVCNTHKCPTWKTGTWSECSVSCGNGIQTREVTCDSDRVPCDKNIKPDSRRVCNTHKCPTWKTGTWSECSVSCVNGVQTREVTCDSDRVPCDKNIKPDSRRVCNTHKCPTWKTGAWSECSVTCGKGFQTRPVSCSSDVHRCGQETKPSSRQHCVKNCSKWIVGPWQQCSVSCNSGVQFRNVRCDFKHGPCPDMNNRPRNTKRCVQPACAEWITSEWSKCSVGCGNGVQSRSVVCSNSEAKCNESIKPSTQKDCKIMDCPSWKTGEWSKCSRTCGTGITSRQVQCVRGKQRVDSSLCKRFEKPPSRKLCELRECIHGTYWKKGKWAKCSTQCSKGLQIRQVTCAARNGTKINYIFCRGRKPRVVRICNEHKQCGSWEIGPWGKCSTSCGDGVRSRAVRCLYNLEYSEEDCDTSTRPIARKACSNRYCPLASKLFAWRTSLWSKCSRTCGYGRKSRRVTCSDAQGGQVSSKYCDQKAKPAEFVPCFEVRCPPKWKFGDWSECSRTCGAGYQVRPVTCEGVPGVGDCDLRKKPPTWRHCNFGPCSREFLWKIGPWTRCSVSCGVGVIERSVRCTDHNGTQRKDSFCRLPALKPDKTRPCRMAPCTPRTCREIQLTSGLQADGEHVLEIQGKLRKIYCHGMTTNNPREYITLKAGYNENFAEVYSKRLRNPNTCNVNESHSDKCSCHTDIYKESGGSYFSKIRLDISKMTIDVDDLEFAMTRGNKFPSYGTAGDCYSTVNCPQGRFSINLKGTGFQLSLDVRWTSHGQSSSQDIYFYPEGEKIFGKCGGYCGTCKPDRGLRLVMSKGNELG